MSLNRSEQRLYDYIEAHREEKEFWVYKVRQLAGGCASSSDAALVIEGELWRYYVERTAVVGALRESGGGGACTRVSMRNLAEYLLRLWGPPAPPKKRAVESV